MELGVEGMMLSPGYSYDKAPDQKHFLGRARTRRLFRAILSNREKDWRFNLSPLFLEFLMGKRHYACTPWGMPTYNIFGWQKPCYLLQDGYADTFEELMRRDRVGIYGTESGNPQVRELHGAQRLRSLGRERHVRLARRLCGHSEGHVVHSLPRRRRLAAAGRAGRTRSAAGADCTAGRIARGDSGVTGKAAGHVHPEA